MGRRIDYLDDPDAPEATSLVPSVNVGVINEAGEVLLIRRTDNDNWALPGGAMDIGETIAEAGVRETREETGIECEIVRLVGVYQPTTLHAVHERRRGAARVLAGLRCAGNRRRADDQP